jgi:signal transduction histidine kinase
MGQQAATLDDLGSPLRALEIATRAIAAELDLDRILQLIADHVRDLVHARYAALGIVGADGRIERFITSGITAKQRAAIGPVPTGHGLLGTIIRDATTLRISDIARHPDTYGFPPNHPEMHSLLGVPVRIEGEPIGNFYLTEKQGAPEFSQSDQDLVELFALHAAIAIQHARLHQRVRDLALVDERLRISRDLHDGIIQAIYAVSLSLEDIPELVERGQSSEAVDRVDRSIDRLHTTISDIRRFITGLGSGAEGPPLRQSLENLAFELHGQSDVALTLDLGATDRVLGLLTPEEEHELVQMAREALSNVARHAQARHARMVVELEANEIVLSVEDDGTGFDPDARRTTGHFGLSNLRDRAAVLGGSARIDSTPGGGTRIIVRLPVSEGETRRS